MEIAASRQPLSKAIRYDNMRSAIAEETLMKMLLREGALFDKTKDLSPQDFSVAMFAKAFEALKQSWSHEQTVGIHTLAEVLTPEEMAHMTAVIHKPENPISEEAFADCLRIIVSEARKGSMENDLRALQQSLQKKKGYGGT